MSVARLILVRHGKAAGRFTDDVDPGLDETGMGQAAAVAHELAPLGPLPLLVSPLRRARETAAPLERAWSTPAHVEPRVAEVRWTSDDLEERGRWLREAMAGTWSDLPEPQRAWRDDVIAMLRAIRTDTVVVSHLIAINAAIGEAVGDDRVLSTMVDNASMTVLTTDGAALELLEVGAEAITEVW